MFRLFFEVQYHANKPDLNRIFPESVHDCSALHVCSFILSILHQGIFSVSAFIVSVIYLSRFKESSHITLHACTWRPLFLTSLLLADKMWEDKPVRNSSLAKLFPVLSNAELNRMESEFLGELRFKVLVKPDLFCSFCEKLLAETVHQEITRCVSSSDYASTLQADHVEAGGGPPVKSSKLVQEVQKEQYNNLDVKANRPKSQSDGKAEVTRHTIGGPTDAHAEEIQRLANSDPHRFDPVPRTAGSSRTASGQGSSTTGWLDGSGPSATGVSVASGGPPIVPPVVSGGDTSGVVPRSQSAGPTTTASRRGEGARLTPGSQPLFGGGVSLRGSNISTTLGSAGISGAGSASHRPGDGSGGKPVLGAGAPPPATQPPNVTSTTPQPPRSVSVHPLHRTESQKKHPMGKVEDQPPEKLSGPPPGRAGNVASGIPLRRSLPAKSSTGYAPLARAPSGGGSSSGISRMGGVDTGGSSRAGAGNQGSGGSGPGSANTTAGSGPRQPPQSSPRSPGSVSPVLVAHEAVAHSQSLSGAPSVGRPGQQPENRGASHSGGRNPTDESAHPTNSAHVQQQAGRSNSHPRVTSAPAGPGRYNGVPDRATMGAGAPRVATPPVPLSSGHLQSHSGQPGQGGPGLNKAQVSSRGTSPGGLAGMGHQTSGSSQPTRASSAPRVSGIAGHHHHAHTATPPGSSSVRTAASQPQSGPNTGSRVGHHVPGSPSMNSPTAANPYPSASPAVPHHYGGGPGGSSTGASVVVFPANPANRGNSPSPALSMVGGQMPMKSGRGTVGSTGGLQRNASPMGIPTPASPAGRTMSPAGNVPHGAMSVSGNRPDLLSTTRGRSPPPGIQGAPSSASTVRAPRAVTPGQIVKGIQQGIGAGNMQRSSFGGGAGMVMHRGIG